MHIFTTVPTESDFATILVQGRQEWCVACMSDTGEVGVCSRKRKAEEEELEAERQELEKVWKKNYEVGVPSLESSTLSNALTNLFKSFFVCCCFHTCVYMSESCGQYGTGISIS